MDQPRYRAFLSYSHRDARWANWLHKALESYRPPQQFVGTTTARGAVPKRLTPVFRDREELASAIDLGAVINQALRDSACQIVICSPQAAKSHWVNEEILAFKRLGREDRIFCLIVGGEPNAADNPAHTDEECFPPALRFRLGADGSLSSTRTEPVAADARRGKDGKQRAKLKLIAGVLGLGYDALARREQQRRSRRLFAVACSALAGMLVASGLAAYALIERAAAQRQTSRAEAEAETARQTTNFMVDLFRISDPSEARGNSVTAREMLDKGAARIDAELAQQPTIQATLMDTVGTVYMGLGLYAQARPLLDGALATRRRVGTSEPALLADSSNHLGELLARQADFDAAERTFREAIAVQASQPSGRYARATLARSLHGLGTVLGQQGRYTEAEHSLRPALALQRQLYGRAHEETATTLKDLARVVANGGAPQAAVQLMQDSVAMQRQLRGDKPHPALAEALNDLGLLLEANDEHDQAEKLYLEALAMKRRLYGERHPEIAVGLNNLGVTLYNKGDLVRAESAFREALAMQHELVGDEHPDVADALNNLAFVLYDRGDIQGALRTERESLVIYRKLFPGDHPEVARMTNRIGFWLTLAGEYEEADRDLREALAMRRRLLGDSHVDIASSLAHLAILQVATGKYSDALQSAQSAAETFTATLSASHWKTLVAECAEGAALTGLGSYAQADALLTHGYRLLAKDMSVPASYRVLARGYLERLHQRQANAQGARHSPAATATKDDPAEHPPALSAVGLAAR